MTSLGMFGRLFGVALSQAVAEPHAFHISFTLLYDLRSDGESRVCVSLISEAVIREEVMPCCSSSVASSLRLCQKGVQLSFLHEILQHDHVR